MITLPAGLPPDRVPSAAALAHLVYVIGTARGGSTMLGECLGLHDRILALPENSNFIGQVWRYRRVVDARLLRILMAQPGYYRRADAIAALPPLAADALAGHIERAMRADDLARLYTLYPLVHALIGEHGRDPARIAAWSDKATDTRGAREVLRAFPEAHLVMMVRDPRGAVASLVRRSARRDRREQDAPRLDLALEQTIYWRRMAQDMLRLRALAPGRALVVRYEDFVAAPAETLNRIFAAVLGAEMEAAELQRRLDGVTYFASNDPGAVARGIRTDAVARWKTELSAAEQRVIAAVAGPTARHLGYSVPITGLGPLRAALAATGGGKARLLRLAKLVFLAAREPAIRA